MWALIRAASRLCNLCLVTSTVMESQLSEQGCRQLEVWKRGVDTNTFNPKFRSDAMRVCVRLPVVPSSGLAWNARRSTPRRTVLF